MRPLSASLVAVAVCSAGTAASTQQTYRNPIIDPIDAAGPTVIRFEGKHCLYPTLDGQGCYVFVSEDLMHWKRHPMCYTDPRGGA